MSAESGRQSNEHGSRLDRMVRQLVTRADRWSAFDYGTYKAPDGRIFTLEKEPISVDIASESGVIERGIVERHTVRTKGVSLVAEMPIDEGQRGTPTYVELTYTTGLVEGFRRFWRRREGLRAAFTRTVEVRNGRFVNPIEPEQVPAIQEAIDKVDPPGAMVPLHSE